MNQNMDVCQQTRTQSHTEPNSTTQFKKYTVRGLNVLMLFVPSLGGLKMKKG